MRPAILFLIVMCMCRVSAQDVMFSSPQTTPLEINPSFAGNDTCSSVRIGYRLQFPKIDPGLHQTYAAASIYLPKPFMYVGVKYKYMYEGAIDVHMAALFAAKYFKLSKNQELRIGLDLSYFQGQFDWNDVDFGDQVDSSGNGAIYPTNDVPRGGSYGSIDWNFGLSYHLYGFHLGLAGYHLTQPNASMMLGQSPVPLRFSLTTGYTYNIVWPWFHHYVGIHVYKNQQATMGSWTVLLSNTIDRKYEINYALGLSNGILKHAFQASYQLKSLTVGYAFDLFAQDYLKGLGNAHECYLVYRFWNRKSKGRTINKGCVWN
ncbi:MAG: PorP/SprF family type IX secretion system membrane protein [Flavobacteriales bacterium]